MALLISLGKKGILIELFLKLIDFAYLTLAGFLLFPVLPGNTICLCENTNLYPDSVFLTIFTLSYCVDFIQKAISEKSVVHKCLSLKPISGHSTGML